MSAMKRTRNPQARAALLAALGLMVGGGIGGVAVVDAQAGARAQVEADEKPKYKSSIQVPNDDKDEGEEADDDDEKGEAAEGKEAEEQNEAASPEERAEAARYEHLARITADQARTAALASVPGTAQSVELENEDGNLVYGVSIKTAAGERDVKVDAGNGKVLHIEKD